MLARFRASSGAFADFYEEMAEPVLAFFARRTDDPHTARDLMGITTARAFEARASFRGASDSDARAWFWKIAYRELARYYESRAVEGSAMQRIGLEVPDLEDTDIRAIERMIATEAVPGEVQEALDTLPATQQEVLRLRYFHELSDDEIAARLDISNEVVRARRSRGLRALREYEHLKGWLELFER
jgi:RNA polymerase sigma-70 factor (ECF subfamily)